jgi:hypothetical protein
VRALALLAVLVLAGCLGGPAPEALQGARVPSLACAVPCVRALDASESRPWEPSVAIDPTDPLHLLAGTTVWERDPVTGARGWLEAHASWDGGLTWERARLAEAPGPGLDEALLPANSMGDAVVAFLPDGTALFAGLGYLHVGASSRDVAPTFARWAYSLFVARSSDGGRTWPESTEIAQGQGLLAYAGLPAPLPTLALPAAWDAQDKPWLAVGADGTVLAAWSELIGLHPENPAGYRQDIVAASSADGGRTWTTPALVERGGQWLGAAPVIAESGWYIAYVDLVSWDLRVATSRDAGATWSSASVDRAMPFPSMAVQAVTGGERLWLAYPDGREAKACDFYWECVRQPPLLRWSDDGGATWSAPLALDAADAPGRTVPAVAVAGDGRLIAAFLHPVEEGARAEVRAVQVRDGIASAPATIGATDAAPANSGDYMGLAAGPAGAFAVWVASPDGSAFDLLGAALR